MVKRGKKTDFSRDHDMCCLYRSGETLEEVSTHYNVCRERVRQILARNGISRKDGGASIKAAKAKKEAQIIRDERVKKYGVSWDEYTLIKKRIGGDAVRNFRNMRNGALTGTRNFKKTTFEISLIDYADIWEASGHEDNKKGFCFSRYDYEKGFTKDNVGIFSEQDKGSRFGKEHGFGVHPEHNAHKIFADDE